MFSSAFVNSLSGQPPKEPQQVLNKTSLSLARQNRTIAIASDFCVDGTKSPEIPQKEGVWGSKSAAPKSQIASDFEVFPSHTQIATQHCSLVSRKSLRVLGSTMGIAIANRKNRCNFGALSRLFLRDEASKKLKSIQSLSVPYQTVVRNHRWA